MSESKDSRRTHAIPLHQATAGMEVSLASINGGRQLQHRLAELGLLPGMRFTIVTNSSPGPVIISLKDTRLMLGRGMAERVDVVPVSTPKQ